MVVWPPFFSASLRPAGEGDSRAGTTTMSPDVLLRYLAVGTRSYHWCPCFAPIADPMKTYVVNLRRSPDRRAHVLAELGRAGLDYELVEGVDGRDLDVSDPQLVAPEFSSRPSFRPGAAGCSLSHMAAYRRILASEASEALIVEDDVVLRDGVAGLLGALEAETTGAGAHDAAVVLLNYTVPAKRLYLSSVSALPTGHQLVSPTSLAGVTSASAYVITRAGCERMVAAMLPLRCFVDEWEWFVSAGVLDRVRSVAPMPVHNTGKFRTTIDHYPPGSLQARVREATGRLAPPFVQRALELRRLRGLSWDGRDGRVELVVVRPWREPGREAERSGG